MLPNQVYETTRKLEALPRLANLDGKTTGQAMKITGDENDVAQRYNCPIGVLRTRWIEEQLHELTVYQLAARRGFIPSAEELYYQVPWAEQEKQG